jgi:integrase/recombinase XerD
MGLAILRLSSPEAMQKASPEKLSLLYKKIESRISIFNQGLKTIALNAKIKKNLSSHVARHSFSDIARKKGHICL